MSKQDLIKDATDISNHIGTHTQLLVLTKNGHIIVPFLDNIIELCEGLKAVYKGVFKQ